MEEAKNFFMSKLINNIKKLYNQAERHEKEGGWEDDLLEGDTGIMG